MHSGIERDSPGPQNGYGASEKGAAMGHAECEACIVFLSLATSWSDEVDSCTDSSEEHEALDDIAGPDRIPQDAENTGTTQILLNTENMQIVPIPNSIRNSNEVRLIGHFQSIVSMALSQLRSRGILRALLAAAVLAHHHV